MDRTLLRVGSTFGWTESYGARPAHDAWRHVAFALAVLAMTSGTAGIVAFERVASRGLASLLLG